MHVYAKFNGEKFVKKAFWPSAKSGFYFVQCCFQVFKILDYLLINDIAPSVK